MAEGTKTGVGLGDIESKGSSGLADDACMGSSESAEACCREQGLSLDPELWTGLPEDVLDKVLARLPAQSLARFRCVCKRWNSILHSRGFLNLCSQTPGRDSWILMFADPYYKAVFAYIPKENKWLHIRLAFLPSHVDNVTAAGGLLCFRLLEANGSSSMCICNPVTRSWRKLPPMRGRWSGNLVGMVMDMKTLRYKVIVQTKHVLPYTLRTEEFDSGTNAWRLTSSSSANFTTGSAFCNGLLYFMAWEQHNGAFICDGVYAYNIDRGTWTSAHAPMPYFYICPHLVECQGRLLMVGGFWEQPALTVGIRVWELQQSSLDWIVVETMPQNLFKHLLKRPGYRLFNCVGHGNLIYLSECTSPHLFVIFDCSQRLWYEVDTSPPDNFRATFSWFSFTPRFDASV
ncbi:hypothetical protein O6H91_21G013300 [Diphasiastrum complanatum]|uniref:Uncharacterized protein n=1 Tax=Diphasiastrum complanatum TaxID=34168 RepID=A0ACC2AI35_DIPCM|nr:hypothetical protein O6H91_21G013300 [Diphasiastrum complanatum]